MEDGADWQLKKSRHCKVAMARRGDLSAIEMAGTVSGKPRGSFSPPPRGQEAPNQREFLVERVRRRHYGRAIPPVSVVEAIGGRSGLLKHY
jgi:hypothetical protein